MARDIAAPAGDVGSWSGAVGGELAIGVGTGDGQTVAVSAGTNGTTLAVGGALAFSLHILATDRAVAGHDVGALLAVQLAVCGVAIVPLSEAGRDISLETPGAARVRLEQIRPKPHTVERTDALPTITRFLGATPDVEVFWLSDGVDLGKSGEFVDGLGRAIGARPITVVDGGVEPARALAATENTAGALSVNEPSAAVVAVAMSGPTGAPSLSISMSLTVAPATAVVPGNAATALRPKNSAKNR